MLQHPVLHTFTTTCNVYLLQSPYFFVVLHNILMTLQSSTSTSHMIAHLSAPLGIPRSILVDHCLREPVWCAVHAVVVRQLLQLHSHARQPLQKGSLALQVVRLLKVPADLHGQRVDQEVATPGLVVTWQQAGGRCCFQVADWLIGDVKR